MYTLPTIKELINPPIYDSVTYYGDKIEITKPNHHDVVDLMIRFNHYYYMFFKSKDQLKHCYIETKFGAFNGIKTFSDLYKKVLMHLNPNISYNDLFKNEKVSLLID